MRSIRMASRGANDVNQKIPDVGRTETLPVDSFRGLNFLEGFFCHAPWSSLLRKQPAQRNVIL